MVQGKTVFENGTDGFDGFGRCSCKTVDEEWEREAVDRGRAYTSEHTDGDRDKRKQGEEALIFEFFMQAPEAQNRQRHGDDGN